MAEHNVDQGGLYFSNYFIGVSDMGPSQVLAQLLLDLVNRLLVIKRDFTSDPY